MNKENRKQTKEKAITLIALVVTIVVLLILAGVTITVLFGDHGIFKTAENATNKFGIESEREKIDNVRIDWWTKKVTGEKVTVDDFFEMLKRAGIIDKREEDVNEPDNNNNTYIVETNSGYTVEIIVDENENIQIGEIVKGNLGAKITSFEVKETTKTSIIVKAEIVRAENAIIKYYYKLSNAEETAYVEMIANEMKNEAAVEGLIEGSEYDVKIIVAQEGFEPQERKIEKVIARDVTLITELTLNKTDIKIGVSKNKELIATIQPESATIKDLNWKSSDETIATVDNTGRITTKNIGIVTITASTKDGSKKQASCTVTVIKATGKFNETKGVNEPNLADGMKAVIWDENENNGEGDWVEPTNMNDWYDYSITAKKWANAMTEDGSIWVWIPRFAYQISSGYHLKETNGGTINIKFLRGVTNTAADGTNTWDNLSGEGKWNVHPAFEYIADVAGIWVAKFEASQNGNTLKIQPGAQSWRNISIDKMYTTCFNYKPNINSHMMKNTEWGAVAYLSQSNYGKNSKITVNTNSYWTGGTNSKIGYKDKTEQSTTGTIYGIYDTSGGSWEYVAAYLDNRNTKITGSYYNEQYGKSLIDGEDYTKDVYSIGTTDNQANNYSAMDKIYGDAIYETSSSSSSLESKNSWYSEYSDFVYSNSVFLRRGGNYDNGSTAGIFAYRPDNGKAQNYPSFRPVLIAF